MRLYDDPRVRPDWGPRPAGPPDKCFYCSQPVGAPHKKDCVILKKSVVIKYEIEMVVRVPENWTANEVEFHRNEGSFCMGNDIEKLYEEDRALEGRCFTCHRARATFLREATKEDHKRLVPVEKP